MAARGPLALACLSFALTVSGAAYAALPAAVPAASASIELPLAVAPTHTVPLATPATEIPAGLGEPHRAPAVIVVNSHAAHQHHMAVVAALKTPAPAVTTATTLPTSPEPVTTTQAPAPAPTQPAPTPAVTTSSPQTGGGSGVGAALLDKALSMSGVPYVYGGDTPSGFDCSGLVYWAALQLGVSSMPRDTFEMLAQGVSSGLLVQVSTPSYGDLAFFGSGHVEFYVHSGETFGAQQPGTVVGYHSYGFGYQPTMFFRVT